MTINHDVLKRSIVLICILFLTAGIMTVAPGCAGSKGQGGSAEEIDVLQGVWVLNKTTTYEFDGQGNGSLGHGDHGHDFTYTIKGDVLTIRLGDSGKEAEYSFALEDDVLSLTDRSKTSAKPATLTRK